MKKSYLFVVVSAILFLFFVQMAGTLIESIYVLDLLRTSLDAKVLGVLFFFAPLVLLLSGRRASRPWVWITFGLLFLARGATPYLNTTGRLLASGIATGATLILLAFLLIAKPKGEAQPETGLYVSAGLGLAVGLSVLLRTVNYGIDYSLTSGGGWAGWGLGLLLGLLLSQLDWAAEPPEREKAGGLTSAVVGILLVLTLVYFAFSAPAVIARWTEGNYTLIVTMVSLLAIGWAWLCMDRPRLLGRLSPLGLGVWNLAFTLCLTGTILVHRVPFPATPASVAVVVGTPTWLQRLPLVLMLLLFPVIFVDMSLFVNRVRASNPAPSGLAPGMLLGSAALVLLVFSHVFTNVWGYVEPVSPWFRNKFWLPYFLMAGAITLLAGWRSRVEPTAEAGTKFRRGWAAVLTAVFLATGLAAMLTDRVQPVQMGKTSLRVMTYNIQQANDDRAERSYERQLALIRKVSPDILALQESDSARISLNNNDYVRYYASKLGYYSYYGPSSVAGTYGTAILSRYPLLNTRSVFTYSDRDEIGTAEAEIDVDGRRFTIYNVHPDGSDTAMLVWAKTLLERSRDRPNVIALGDYNLRDYEQAYQMIASVYTNAWVSVYPSEIGPDGTDMSGENRIDHIFFSRSLSVRQPVYVLPPASATDHPVHWAEIFWQ